MESTQLVGNVTDILQVNTNSSCLDVTFQFLLSDKNNMELYCNSKKQDGVRVKCFGNFPKEIKMQFLSTFLREAILSSWKLDHMQSRIITVFTEVMGYWIFLHIQMFYYLITFYPYYS